MDSPSNLLADTRATVARWPGFSTGRTFTDSAGDYAFLAIHDNHTFACACKRYAHNDRASFMEKLVDRAAGEGYLLCEFIGETPTLDTGWVFAPATVRAAGDPSRGESAKGVDTAWLEVDLTHGETLGRVAIGGTDPPQPTQTRLSGVGP